MSSPNRALQLNEKGHAKRVVVARQRRERELFAAGRNVKRGNSTCIIARQRLSVIKDGVCLEVIFTKGGMPLKAT